MDSHLVRRLMASRYNKSETLLPEMRFHKFGMELITKKNTGSDCPFCKEEMLKGMMVILTNCCNNYIHYTCCKGWDHKSCPCCGTNIPNKSLEPYTSH